MQQWEYKIISRGFSISYQDVIWFDTEVSSKEPDAVANRLNAEGKDGWELIHVEDLPETDFWIAAKTYYLKRLITK